MYHIISNQVLQASIPGNPFSCFCAGDELAIYIERRIGNPYVVQRKSIVFIFIQIYYFIFLFPRFLVQHFYHSATCYTRVNFCLSSFPRKRYAQHSRTTY